MTTDVTYMSENEKKNESTLLNRMCYIYCNHVNPSAKIGDVSVKNTAGGFKNQAFTIYENGVAKATYSIATPIWQDILRGNKEPKISSKFFKPI